MEINTMAERNSKGHFVKGTGGGNPSGRPKGVKLTASQRKLFKDDPKAALLWLMNTADDRKELLTVAKLVIDYVSPKLSAIKQEVTTDNKLVIEWQGQPNKTVVEGEFEVIKEYKDKDLSKLTKKELTEIAQSALNGIDTAPIES